MKEKRLFLLDMDGTIYLSGTLFDGTKDFLAYVKSIGGRSIFLTNNSSRGTDAYIERMKGFGIETTADDFITSADVAVDYLSEHYKEAVFYVVGTQSLKAQLRAFGFTLRENPDEDVSVLLLGYDTELNYKKLEEACILLNRGVTYIATHADPVCPTWYGSAPDAGSFIEMLYTATKRRPLILGKPQPEIAKLAMKQTGFAPQQTCVIGDRIYTDIACGVNAGVDSVFVLSGEGVLSDIEKYQVTPTYIYPNIRALLNDLQNQTHPQK